MKAISQKNIQNTTQAVPGYDRLAGSAAAHLHARAEVAELVWPRRRPEDVLQLDVSVRDALVVQILDGAGSGVAHETYVWWGCT